MEHVPSLGKTLPQAPRYDRVFLLGAIFFGSGFASLIYQVAWQRLLTLYYGVGAVSATLIVTVYMLGLGIGALAGGWLAEKVKHKILCYCCVELCLGLFGVLSFSFLEAIGSRTAGSPYPATLACLFAFLFVPTTLMGITLPLITKIFSELIQDFAHSISFLYFINALGAAAGALVSGYILISWFGLLGAIRIAAALNFLLTLLIAVVMRFPAPAVIRVIDRGSMDFSRGLGRFAYIWVFVTGFLAIGYEIIWFRICGVLVKDSPYSFSTVLAVYLLGIACGSYWMERQLRKLRPQDLRSRFFLLQGAIGGYVIVSTAVFYYATQSHWLGAFARRSFSIVLHPTPVVLSLGWSRYNLDALYSWIDLFQWPILLLLLPTIFMGASFPLISVLAVRRQHREGETVGGVYFWNVLGNVAGGVATGFLLLPLIGTENTLLVFGVVGVAVAIFASAFHGAAAVRPKQAVPIGLAVLLVVLLFPRRGDLWQAMHGYRAGYDTYVSEGREGVVVTYVNERSVLNYIGGQAHGGRPGTRFKLETIEALAYCPAPRNVLVIGYGTGTMMEIVLNEPLVRKVTLVEINETLMSNLARIPLFRDLLGDRERIEIVLDDARRFLYQTGRKWDAVMIDPLRTSTAYSGNIYSVEFMRLIGEHLVEDGVFLIWMDEHSVIPATVQAAFPRVRLYRFRGEGGLGKTGFAIASSSSFREPDEARKQSLISQLPASERQAIHPREVTYAGDEGFITRETAGVRINRDWRPVTEYYLGPKGR